jgi:hypothetical protein
MHSMNMNTGDGTPPNDDVDKSGGGDSALMHSMNTITVDGTAPVDNDDNDDNVDDPSSGSGGGGGHASSLRCGDALSRETLSDLSSPLSRETLSDLSSPAQSEKRVDSTLAGNDGDDLSRETLSDLSVLRVAAASTAGVFFAWAYVRTGRLWLPIVLHVLNNTMTTVPLSALAPA